MANPEHLKVLKRGVEAWNQWRKKNLPKEEHLEVVPDLSGADLRNADLQRANLRDADLRSARLTGANLRMTDLRSANLSLADFSGGRLARADFSYASVIGTFLRKADLQGADFERSLVSGDFAEASLTNAKFSKANIATTHFLNADLSGADFTEAKLFNSTLSGVDLSCAIGLEQVVHLGPSSIGADTLERTASCLPPDSARHGAVEVFLRGAGLSNEMIEYYRSMIGQPVEFFSSFVSYSHSDRVFTRRLYDQLQGRGIRCWLDEHDMYPGDRILEVVNQAIRVHDRVLLCCSEASLESWWVKDEIRKAQERERQGDRDIIIPLMVDRYLLDGWEDGLAADLRSRLAADFTGWEHDNAKFEEQFERVVQALRTDEVAREKAPESKV